MGKALLCSSLLLLFLSSVALADSPNTQSTAHLEVWGTEYVRGEEATLYAQLLDESGAPINSGTVTYKVFDSSGNLYHSGTLAYVPGTNGIYADTFECNQSGNFVCDVVSVPSAYATGEVHVSNAQEILIMGLVLALIALSITFVGLLYRLSYLLIVAGVCWVLEAIYLYHNVESTNPYMPTAWMMVGLSMAFLTLFQAVRFYTEMRKQPMLSPEDEQEAYIGEIRKRVSTKRVPPSLLLRRWWRR